MKSDKVKKKKKVSEIIQKVGEGARLAVWRQMLFVHNYVAAVPYP